MNKEIIIAKIRRQQAEIREMIAILKEDRRNRKIIEVLKKRCRETKKLIETLEEKSFIPRGVEEVDVTPELKKIEKKVGKVKAGVERLKKLEEEKARIEKKISE